MGTKLVISAEHNDLYSYWGTALASGIETELDAQLKELTGAMLTPLIINCASQEYSKSVIPHVAGNIKIYINILCIYNAFLH